MDKLINKLGSYEKIKELSSKELFDLVDEIRDFLKESICRTGGHLGVNTGVVELTIALHYVFDSLHDKFVWDVGHNVYVHKILTGRADLLHTLRQDEGSPGFPAKDAEQFWRENVALRRFGKRSLPISANQKNKDQQES